MQTVIDNILTNYQIFGENNKKTILILHGWGQSSKNWFYIGMKISENNKVILLDLPGFGSSSQQPFDFSVVDYATFVGNFIKKLNLKYLTLIGHSFGGKIATLLGSQTTLVKRLILIAPSGTETNSIFPKLKIFLVKMFKFIFFWIPKLLKQKIFNILASTDYKNAGNLKGTFKRVVSEKILNKAREIRIPTLIIWGENDNKLPIKDAKKLKRVIKGSTLRIIWGEGHSPNIEAPEKLINLLLEYL